ncbi:hypothetical protein GCM10023195_07440 [Actinoallomurus liliacearum]|uniref:Uncharacterized protein n=1 Tax=Actinoallomurus liliacearum TaxID=1080073 RepID=A0ABP8TAC3_9ACTN
MARQVAARLGISRASTYDHLAEARTAASPDGAEPGAIASQKDGA